jgi:hypothetical protein
MNYNEGVAHAIRENRAERRAETAAHDSERTAPARERREREAEINSPGVVHDAPAARPARQPRQARLAKLSEDELATRANAAAAAEKKTGPALSPLDKAVEQLVAQYTSGAVIDAAWAAAHRLFKPAA